MMPSIFMTLDVSESIFGVQIANGSLGDPTSVGVYSAVVGSIDVIYITTGFLVFPKILED